MRRLEIRERTAPGVAKASTGVDILEADRRDKPGGVLGVGDLGVELVDLLKGEALSLVDEEVDEGAADDTEATPEEEDLRAEIGVAGTGVDEVGC